MATGGKTKAKAAPRPLAIRDERGRTLTVRIAANGRAALTDYWSETLSTYPGFNTPLYTGNTMSCLGPDGGTKHYEAHEAGS